jgi:DnaK suppressor protein
MSALTDRQRRNLATKLEERERALYADVQREQDKREDYPSLIGDAPDAGDASVGALQKDLDEAEIGRDLDELRELADARLRVASNDYGVCIDCKTDISYERLEANPAALRCVECQSRHEQQFANEGVSIDSKL